MTPANNCNNTTSQLVGRQPKVKIWWSYLARFWLIHPC